MYRCIPAYNIFKLARNPHFNFQNVIQKQPAAPNQQTPSVEQVLHLAKECNGKVLYQRLIEYFPVLHDIKERHLLNKINMLKERKKKLSRNKLKVQLDEFLISPFKIVKKCLDLTPRKNALVHEIREKDHELKKVKKELKITSDKLSTKTENENLNLEIIIDEYKTKVFELNSLSENLEKARSELIEKGKLKIEIEKIKSAYEEKSNALDNLTEKFHNLKSKYQPRNVNKREKRKEEKINEKNNTIENIESKNCEQQELNEKMERELAEAYVTITEMQTENSSLKRKQYYNNKKIEIMKSQIGVNEHDNVPEIVAGKMKENENLIDDLLNQIEELKGENKNLEYANELLQEDKFISTFQNGRYTDDIRECILNLLQMNVSAKNVSAVIRTVLQKIAKCNVDRLPSHSLNLRLAVEGRLLSLIETSREMLESNKDDNVLHNDGTSRHKKSYTTTQITSSFGTRTVGLTEIVSENTNTLMETNKHIFKELSELRSTLFDTTSADEYAHLIASISSSMSDRGAVEVSFNRSFEEYRKQFLPQCIPNWNEKSESEKAQLEKVYNFYCFMHIVINMASYASEALKAFDQAAIENYKSMFGQSSTDTAIANAVRAFQKHGDEQSGQTAAFDAYLESIGKKNQFKKLKGNRANILFMNGGAYYYHLEHMAGFLNIWAKKPSDLNNRLRNVLVNLQNKVSTAGARALGILEKIVTTPLSQVIEKTNNILDMSVKVLELQCYVSEMSRDASAILNDPKILFDSNINKGDVYAALFKDQDEELDALTIQAIELICQSWLLQFQRMLSEYMPGGIYSADNNFEPEIKRKFKNVPPTNRSAERQFASFDKIQHTKPAAKLLYIESSCIIQNNNLKEQLDNVPLDLKPKFFELARQNAPKIQEEFRERQKQIMNKRIEILKVKEQENAVKLCKERTEKSDLCEAIAKMGGEWKSSNEVEEKVSAYISEIECKEGLKKQIKFKKIILKAQVPKEKNYLFQFSKEGKLFSVEQLKCNLQEIIELNPHLRVYSEEDEEVILSSHVYIPIEKRSELIQKQKEIFKEKLEKLKRAIPVSVQTPCNLTPEFLVGKKIEHLFEVNVKRKKGKGIKQKIWYSGFVKRVVSRGENSIDTIFEVHYERFDDSMEPEICEFDLLRDFAKKEVRIV